MSDSPAWYRRFFPLLVVAIILCGLVLWQLLQIQLRLSRNGAIARQLASSLREKYAGVEFRGNASYEREVVYLTVGEGFDQARLEELERWLRNQKTERGIGAAIWLQLLAEPDKWIAKL